MPPVRSGKRRRNSPKPDSRSPGSSKKLVRPHAAAVAGDQAGGPLDIQRAVRRLVSFRVTKAGRRLPGAVDPQREPAPWDLEGDEGAVVEWGVNRADSRALPYGRGGGSGHGVICTRLDPREKERS